MWRKTKTILIALVAVFSIGATQAIGTASALASGQPRFEATLPETFSITGGETSIENTAGAKVQCQSVSSALEFAPYVAIDGHLMLHSCTTKVAGFTVSCTTSGASTGEITTTDLNFHLYYLVGGKDVGMRIENIEHGTIATFTCAGSKIPFSLKGSTLAKITPKNTITYKYTLILSGAKGVQELTQYENASGEKQSTLLQMIIEGKAQNADVNGTGLELHSGTSSEIIG